MPRPLTPEQRHQRAKLAAYSRWSKEDPGPALAQTRKGFWLKFVDEVDPDRVLSPTERERRAEAAMKAHMTALSLRSSRARTGGAA